MFWIYWENFINFIKLVQIHNYEIQSADRGNKSSVLSIKNTTQNFYDITQIVGQNNIE